MTARDPHRLRELLRGASLMLVFTPELCGERSALEVLDALAPEVDLIQVRPKALATTASAEISSDPAAEARASHDWTLRVLDLLVAHEEAPPVLVNDRVDVALALLDRGCAGVHLGQGDLPPQEARSLLGEAALVGLSTHDVRQVVLAGEEPVDYLGFGPVFASGTKGYQRGLGPEACWVASTGTALPLFPIGGIVPENADELEQVGRAAVSSALLTAEDPVAAARSLRAELEGRARSC